MRPSKDTEQIVIRGALEPKTVTVEGNEADSAWDASVHYLVPGLPGDILNVLLLRVSGLSVAALLTSTLVGTFLYPLLLVGWALLVLVTFLAYLSASSSERWHFLFQLFAVAVAVAFCLSGVKL